MLQETVENREICEQTVRNLRKKGLDLSTCEWHVVHCKQEGCSKEYGAPSEQGALARLCRHYLKDHGIRYENGIPHEKKAALRGSKSADIFKPKRVGKETRFDSAAVLEMILLTRPKTKPPRERQPNQYSQNRKNCEHGHAFTPENIYIRTDGVRCCRTCRNERNKKVRLKKAVASKEGLA